jgi:hypothetical protein
MAYRRSRYRNFDQQYQEEYPGNLSCDRRHENEHSHKPNPRQEGLSTADRKEEGMASWLQRQAGSHNVQLAAAAVFSGAAVAAGIYSYQALKRNEAVEELKASIPEINERHHVEKVCLGPYHW